MTLSVRGGESNEAIDPRDPEWIMEFDPDWWTPTTDEYDDETAEQDTEIRFTIERGRPGYAFNGEGE